METSTNKPDKSRLIAAIIVFGLMFLGILFSLALEWFSSPNSMRRNGVITEKIVTAENDEDRYAVIISYKYMFKSNTREMRVTEELYETINIGDRYSWHEEEIRSQRQRNRRNRE